MAKALKDILAGVKSSKTEKLDLKDLQMSPNKDNADFIAKHEVEKNADRVGNDCDTYKGKTSKTSKYKFQKDGVYEESEEESDLDEAERVRFIGKQNPADLPPRPADYKPGDFGSKLAAAGGLRYPGKKKPSRPLPLPVKESGGAGCNHTMEGVMCEVHGESACPTKENDVNMQKSKKKDSKGREYLADKKKVMDEGRIEDDAQRRAAKELSAIAAKSNVPVTKLKPGKKSYNELKSTGSMFGGARQFAAGVAKRNIEAGAEHKSSVGKAKVGGKIKEETEYLDEVLSAKDPASTWIHHFVHSKNPKFEGKSTKQRQQMALGAYYDAKRKKNVKESGTATNTDYTGPGAAGWSTGRLDVGTL